MTGGPQQPAPDFRSQVDQAEAMSRDPAPAIATFWKRLREEGMTADAATAVVCTWIETTFRSVR